jgi:DNA-binding transcriptional ArsR family regulator
MALHDVVVALHHPVRRRISEILRIEGPATVGKLVDALDLPFGSVSHHLRALAKAGLVEPAPDLANDGRQSWWRSVPMSFSWSVDDFTDPAERAVAEGAELENAVYETQQIRTWHEKKEGYDRSWRDASWATNGWMVATPEDLNELGRKINDLIVEYGKRRKPGDPDTAPAFVLARGFPGNP